MSDQIQESQPQQEAAPAQDLSKTATEAATAQGAPKPVETVTQPDRPQAETRHPDCPETSKTMASCGRVVHVRSKNWSGPRPALVIAATMSWSGESAMVEVDPVIRRDSDPAQPGPVTVPLFDPLTDAQRAYVGGCVAFWAEWMPYQAGQAKRTDAAEGPVKSAIALLAAHANADVRAEIEALFK